MGVLVSLKNDAQSAWHPSLSDIKNNTNTMSQAKKKNMCNPFTLEIEHSKYWKII